MSTGTALVRWRDRPERWKWPGWVPVRRYMGSPISQMLVTHGFTPEGLYERQWGEIMERMRNFHLDLSEDEDPTSTPPARKPWPFKRITTEGPSLCELDSRRRYLIATVGLPRAGKTTWLKQMRKEGKGLGGGVAVVSPDEVRLALHGQRFLEEREPEVWGIVRVMMRSLAQTNRIIVFDATNLTVQRRRELVGMLRPKRFRPVWVPFLTDAETCIDRAWRGGRKELGPVIQRMSEKAEWPDLSEGMVVSPERMLYGLQHDLY